MWIRRSIKGDFISYDVAVDLKIYLEDVTKINEVKIEVEKIGKVQNMREEELGFGIKTLKLTILLNDSEGGMDAAEEKIKNIKYVSELEVENITRIS
ncbi:MAG: elongation factor 1-beta [Candidatus Micrarchaeota archaeon]